MTVLSHDRCFGIRSLSLSRNPAAGKEYRLNNFGPIGRRAPLHTLAGVHTVRRPEAVAASAPKARNGRPGARRPGSQKEAMGVGRMSDILSQVVDVKCKKNSLAPPVL